MTRIVHCGCDEHQAEENFLLVGCKIKIRVGCRLLFSPEIGGVVEKRGGTDSGRG